MDAGILARRTLLIACWMLFAGLSGLIAWNSLGYFHAPEETAFFEEKAAAAAIPAWRVTLYVHVAAGIVCLAASLFQFFRGVRRRFPGVHRCMGRVYATSVLWVLCPTGCYLALYAKGGIAGQGGFLLLGALTFYTTWRGVQTMKTGDVPGHARWMIRSFSMAASAITFRIWHIALFNAGWSYEADYVASLWLSIAGNAAVAEWAARKIRNHANPYEKPIHEIVLRSTGDPMRQSAGSGVTEERTTAGAA
jgi:uncharacterized membrane protein